MREQNQPIIDYHVSSAQPKFKSSRQNHRKRDNFQIYEYDSSINRLVAPSGHYNHDKTYALPSQDDLVDRLKSLKSAGRKQVYN
jgi:hypothetical protein